MSSIQQHCFVICGSSYWGTRPWKHCRRRNGSRPSMLARWNMWNNQNSAPYCFSVPD